MVLQMVHLHVDDKLDLFWEIKYPKNLMKHGQVFIVNQRIICVKKTVITYQN